MSHKDCRRKHHHEHDHEHGHGHGHHHHHHHEEDELLMSHKDCRRKHHHHEHDHEHGHGHGHGHHHHHHHEEDELLMYESPSFLVKSIELEEEEDIELDYLKQNLPTIIEHTNLKPDATDDDIRQLCEEAKEHGFFAVCVNPGYVPLACALLEDSLVQICTVVGFPLGATMPEIKMLETELAILAGADEIDMVINVGALKSGNYEWVLNDIQGVVNTCHQHGIFAKVILEMGLLTEEEKVTACTIAQAAGADFIKTSTGFSTGGATIEDIALIKNVSAPGIGIKAAGGISDRETALKLIDAGAVRIGTSHSLEIIKE